jgi:tRNA (guanine-N7-)-methyltransferase
MTAAAAAAAPVIRRRSVYADRLLDHREFTFSDGAEFARGGAWRDFFRQRIGPTFSGRVIFEIGCNDGALLTRVASRHPATAFVGIDWKCRALHTAAERVAAVPLPNVALVHGRAQDVGRIFGEGELDEIWVFHPDPCDKPNELRNRLIAKPFLLGVHRVLRDGAALVLKTDHPDYYASTLDVYREVADHFVLSAHSPDFWNDKLIRQAVARRCFADEVTCFEQRYKAKRRPIHYVELTKR